MLQAKPKLCNSCGQVKSIWKRQGGQRFCKDCWNCQSNKNLKPTKQKPLSPRSSKKEKLDAAYSVLRKAYLQNHPMCEVRLPGCSLEAHDIHHKKGRVGELFLDDTEFLSVCRSCHTEIHNNPQLAKDLGFYH